MAQAVRTTTVFCPVAHHARRAALLIAAHQRADKRHAWTNIDRLQERLYSIEEEVSYERACSPLGGFFQALLIAADVGASDWTVDTEEARRLVRRVRRFAGSIAALLEPADDRIAANMLRTYYLNPHYEEFTQVERLLRAAG